MEEALSETSLRLIHCLITILSGIVVCSAQILSGDILTGTAYNLLTRQGVPPGILSHVYVTDKVGFELLFSGFDRGTFFHV